MAAILRLTTGVVYLRSVSGALPITGSVTLTAAGNQFIGPAADNTAAPPFSFTNDLNTGIGSQAADTLGIVTGGTERWRVTSAGHLIAVLDNTYDIGASAATRPRSIYTGTNFIGADATALVFGVRGKVQAASDGVFTLLDNAGTSFARVQLGGTTSSFPAIKRNAAVIDFRLADDSNVCNITAGDITAAASNFIGFVGRGFMSSTADGTIRLTNSGVSSFSSVFYGPSASATSSNYIQKKITGIADNSATTVFTVTVPNANHAVAVRLMFLSSNGSTDAFESSRCASGMVVCTRTTGAAAVATAATIDDAAIATIPASATHTLAYAVTAPAGGAGATNTFTITVTIDDSGNLGSNQVVAIAELLNAEATGCTIA